MMDPKQKTIAQKPAFQDSQNTEILLHAIRKAYEVYLGTDTMRSTFDTLLQELLSLTDSEFGSLEEVYRDEAGECYKLCLAMSDISWDERSKRLFNDLIGQRRSVRNMKNLAGQAVVNDELVIANDVLHDPRAQGLPKGHPPIRSYMGVPLHFGGQLIGMIGLANRPGGYNEELANWLEPFLAACASIIHAERRDEHDRELARISLQESELRFRATIENAPFGIHMYELHDDGNLIFIGANAAADKMLGVDHEQFEGRTIEDAFPGLVGTPIPATYKKISAEGGLFATQVKYEDEKGINGVFDIQAFQSSPKKMAVFFLDVTQQTLAKIALEESEAKFRGIAEQLHDALFMTDVTGAIKYMSPSSEALFGCPTEEMIGHVFTDYLAESDIGKAFSSFQESMACGHGVVDLELLMKRSNGELFHGELASSFMRKEGEITGTIGIIRDITGRIKMETALKESEERYRFLVQNTNDIILVIDDKGLFRFISPSITRVTGYEISDLAGQNAFEKIHPDDLPGVLHAFAENIGNPGISVRLEYRYRHKDGNWRHFEANAVNLLHDPQANGVLVSVRDISERKTAEKALVESEQKHRLLAENSSDVIWKLNLDMSFSYISPAIFRLFGHSPETAMNYPLDQIMTPESLNRFLTNMQKEIAGDPGDFRPGVVEVEMYRHDGSTLWAEVTYSILRDDNGIPLGVQGATRDITERKTAEMEVQRNEERLRSLVNILQSRRESIQELLDYALDEAIQLTDSKIGYIYFYNEDRKEFVLYTWSKDVMKECTITEPETTYQLEKTGIWGEAVRQGKPIILNDYQAPHPLKKGYPEGHAHLSRFMTAPLFSNGKIVAVIGVANKIESYNESDLLQLTLLMDTVWKMVEHKRAEEKAARLVAILESTSDLVSMSTTEKQIIYLNPAGRNLIGMALNENIENYAIPNLHPAWAMELIKTVGLPAAIRNGSWEGETALVNRDGREIPVSQVILSHRSADGKIEFFSTIMRDLTERKKMEEALEKRLVALTKPLDDTESITFEDLFNVEEIQSIQDLFAQATSVASIITHTDGTPITRPSNFCRLCSDIIRQTEQGRINCYKSDAVLGRQNPNGPIVQPCLSGGLWDAGASISVGGRHIANWLIGQVRDETQTESAIRRYARSIGVNEDEAAKAFQEVPGMSLDQFEKVSQTLFVMANQLSMLAYRNIQQARFITEQKRADEEKTRLQDQLQQAMKMEAIGRLAGGVAHDFNNLLTGITGNLSLAMMDLAPGDPLMEMLQQVNGAADSAAALIRQLLAFSRKQIIEPKVLSLNDLIGNLHKMLIRLIGEDVELQTMQGVGLGAVKIDPGQFEQVLVNLAVNARDAMPDGGKLVIETKNVDLDEQYSAQHVHTKPGRYVMLAVSDTGHGMSEEVKEHLFEPFFTTKPKGRGTGLGLATIFGAVKQAGGSIEVYSEIGKGTSFKIYLPRVEEKAVKLSKERLKPDLPGGDETILLVEDEKIVRDLAIKILKRLGYNVISAPNGGEAFMLMEKYEGHVDLLMTDVVMPGMNGRELAERLTKIQPEMKVLFSSGYTENVIVHHGVVEESLNFIGKPYTTQALAKKIREILDAGGK